jgi:hypothetical protein
VTDARPSQSRISAAMSRVVATARAWPARISSWQVLPLAWFLLVGASCCLPLLPDNILQTIDNDLANHVRHTYEYGLALKQHQFPPLVAPTLNGDERIPLFQYYSGTGYLVSGLLSALGVDAYFAIKLTIMLHLAAGGFFSYLACRRLGIRSVAAFAAGTAFELFPFVGIDLFVRGAYPEILACSVLPLLLYLVIGLAQARGRRPILAKLCATAVAWAYFLAIHPIQAVLGSVLVMALGCVYAILDETDRPFRQRWRGPAAIFGSAALALVGTLWFWWPIMRDYSALRVVHQYNFFADVGLNHLAVLLWPGYRAVDSVTPYWAPQLGLHFLVAAAIVLVAARRARAIAIASALILIAIVIVIRWHGHIPLADQLFEPLQWSYRLLVPAALVGMLCIGFALDTIARRFPDMRGGLVLGVCVGYVLALGIPYFADRGKIYLTFGSEGATSRAHVSVNADYYGLRGSDFRDLGLIQNSSLPVGIDIALAAAAPSFHIRLVLRAPTSRSSLRVLVDGRPVLGATTRRVGRTATVQFGVRPITTVTASTGNRTIHFDPAVPGEVWRVVDVSFHPDGDPAGQWIRLPRAIVPGGAKSATWRIDVPRGKAGLYQLPVLYVPNNVQFVNGHSAAEASSDRFMTIVRLRGGENMVRFETHPSPLGVVGLIVLLLAAAGAGAARVAARVRTRTA